MKTMTVKTVATMVTDAVLENGLEFVGNQLVNGKSKEIIMETVNSMKTYSGKGFSSVLVNRENTVVSHVSNNLNSYFGVA